MDNNELLQQITQHDWELTTNVTTGENFIQGVCEVFNYNTLTGHANGKLIVKAPELLKRNIELEKVLIEARELAQSVGYTFGNYNPTTIGGMMASDAKKVKDKIDQLIPIKYKTNE